MTAKVQQEALDFGRLYRVDEGARRVYRYLADAVDQTGVLPAARACRIDREDLRRALDRDGRKIAVEHAMSIAAIVDSFDLRQRICSAFLEPLGPLESWTLPMTTSSECPAADGHGCAPGAVRIEREAAVDEAMGHVAHAYRSRKRT